MQMSWLDPKQNESHFDASHIKPLQGQLLKWIGNKQRFAYEIINFFPKKFNFYHEPFLGSGAVLATLNYRNSMASDSFKPLIDIFTTLQTNPEILINWYVERWHLVSSGIKKDEFEKIKASYNKNPNPADLLFITRACYGGVVRFRKNDGYISTPVGIHDPISPESFSKRVKEWHGRIIGTHFSNIDYKEAMSKAKQGDLIYCDPPYTFSQGIIYGAQEFNLQQLFIEIEDCKKRGVYVALSIDGTKKSGDTLCDLKIPEGLFKREVFISVGRSMLRRFQMNGKTLEKEHVNDRLLLTY